MEHINFDYLKERIEHALAEDIGNGDVTAGSVVQYDHHARAAILAKQAGVVAGLSVAELAFQYPGPPLEIDIGIQDGESVTAGTTVLRLEGSGRTILQVERTALNLLGRLSGIATLTRHYVDAVEGTGVQILDTRKTTPLWRDLEKYAVRVGGGTNHRMGLYDMVLIKENHIVWAGGIENAVRHATDLIREKSHAMQIEVEVASLEELQSILRFDIDRVLLDNMTPDQITKAVRLVDQKVQLEVSGGITLDNIRQYAESGVDYISVGALTHSAPAFDFSLLFEKN